MTSDYKDSARHEAMRQAALGNSVPVTGRAIKEAPGVARLRSEEQRTRPTRGLPFLQPATDPFLSAQQEHDLFVELKRQGKVRAKAGFGDIEPYLAAYKDAVRQAALEP